MWRSGGGRRVDDRWLRSSYWRECRGRRHRWRAADTGVVIDRSNRLKPWRCTRWGSSAGAGNSRGCSREFPQITDTSYGIQSRLARTSRLGLDSQRK
jgi:hypothetical protein